MLNNYFTLAALLNEERESLEGSRIVAAYSRIESTLSIVVEKPESELSTLVISCKPRTNYMFLDKRPPGRTTGANVFREIIGANIISARVEDGERIVVLRISGTSPDQPEAGDERFLRINLFGTHANVYVVDNDGRTIGSFLRRKTVNMVALDRGLGERTFPENRNEFVNRWKAERGSPLQKLVKIIPSFSGELSKEIFCRLSGEEEISSDASILDDEQLVKLFLVVSEIHRELADPHPRIYFKNDAPVSMSLIEMKHFDSLEEKVFDSVNSCVGAFASAVHRRGSDLELKNSVVKRLLKQKDELQNTISKIEQDLSRNREEEYRSYGEHLMQHLHDIKKGASSFSLSGAGDNADIPLDPSLSIVKNAQQYFEKSKKVRQSRRLSIARKEELKKSLAKIEHELQDVVRMPEGPYSGDSSGKREADLKRLLSIEKRKKREDEIPFRQFETMGYRIYVGKDASNNDKLTFGFAKPNDVFLHVRGVSGSHVIIRNPLREYPQKPVLQFAASIAAHYSKARSSGIVPVAYTMRKFVKKARGQPGAVLLDREEVIFVKPGIP
jgi:predicted ribosome quality control (RQC) complex YloA/Tae2 family protein